MRGQKLRGLDGLGHAGALASLDFDQFVQEQLVVLVNGDVLGGGYKFGRLLPVVLLLLLHFDLLADFAHLRHRFQVLDFGTLRLNLLQFLLVLLLLATSETH